MHEKRNRQILTDRSVELSDKDFKGSFIKILLKAIMGILETNRKLKISAKKQDIKKESSGNLELKNKTSKIKTLTG